MVFTRGWRLLLQTWNGRGSDGVGQWRQGSVG
jgi:hypothetical protein